MAKTKITITGEEKLFSELDMKFSLSSMEGKIDRALIAGAKVIKRELQRTFSPWSDTGSSISEITISQPMTLNNKRTVMIHWKGPKNRYKIIHINEFGSIHRPNPRGKGAIQNAIQAGRKEYFDVIKNNIARAL